MSRKYTTVDALVLKIESKKAQLAALTHKPTLARTELSQDSYYAITNDTVVSIHTFLHSYLSTAKLYPTEKITIYKTYTNALMKTYRWSMFHNRGKGDSHSFNICMTIGLYMKEALERGLRDWKDFVRRLINIANSLESEAEQLGIDLHHYVIQELLRHLYSIEYYYERLLEHKQPDLAANEELYEMSYSWSELCWKYRLAEPPYSDDAIYEAVGSC